jgi:two-component sensor histidine kinase
MRISLKLAGSFALMALLVGLVGYSAGRVQRRVEGELDRLSRGAILSIVDATIMNDAVSAAHFVAYDLLRQQSDDGTTQPPTNDVRRLVKRHRDTIETCLARFDRSLERSQLARESLLRDATGRGMSDTENDNTPISLARLAIVVREYRNTMTEFLLLAESDPRAADRLFDEQLTPRLNDQVFPLIRRLQMSAEKEFASGVGNVTRAMSRARIWRNCTTLISLAVSIGLGFLIATSIGRPLGKLTRATTRLAAGHLDTRVDVRSHDEVGALAQAFNQMAASLQSTTVSLEEKEVLLKEVHHRVKNNLQIISSLLNLRASKAPTEEAARSLRDSQSRIHSMALIHQQLYRSDNLASIDFGQYVRELTTHLTRSVGAAARNIDVEVNVESAPLSIDLAIPCGMIVNELVTNAMEHAFPEGRAGSIGVSFRSIDHLRELTVSDNGVGLDTTDDDDSPASLGLQVVHALVEQIGGRTQVEHNDGTRYAIQFEAADQQKDLGDLEDAK